MLYNFNVQTILITDNIGCGLFGAFAVLSKLTNLTVSSQI